MERIKQAYSSHPDFLDLIQQFQSRSMDKDEFTAAMARIFRAQPHLLASLDANGLPVESVVKRQPAPPPPSSAASDVLSDDEDDVLITGEQASPSTRVQWRCYACSFINTEHPLVAQHQQCEICNTPKPRWAAPYVPSPPLAAPKPQPTQPSAVQPLPPPTVASPVQAPLADAAAVSSKIAAAFADISPSSTSPVLFSDSGAPSCSSSSSSLDAVTQSSSAPLEAVSSSVREAKAEKEDEPPPAYLPVSSGMKEVEAAIVALRQQLTQSLALASPPPAAPADDKRSPASTRELCTELTQQLALFAHFRLACRGVTDAFDSTRAHITQLVQQQTERNALLLATLTQLTRDDHTLQPSEQVEEQTEATDEAKLREQEKAEQAEQLCPICLDQPCDALVQPCCHNSCCMACARKLKKAKKKCPRCHKRIEKIITIRR